MSSACAELSTDWQHDFDAIWHVDFEYREDANHLPVPVCMFAREQHTGTTIELWRDQLLQCRRAPFDTGRRSLMVAFAANAELSCFLALGWPFPHNVLDLYVETIAAINGNTAVWLPEKRPGLLAALELHGLTGMSSEEKKDMRQVILDHSDYSEQQRRDIQAYNRKDVEATLALLSIMAPSIDLPRALLRGRYMGAVARMERVGIPVDRDGLDRLLENWDAIKRFYIERDDDFELYDGDLSFSRARLQELVDVRGWDWPRTPSGQLKLEAKTLGRQARRYPEFKKTAQLFQTIGSLKISSLANTIGADAYSRCPLLPFWTKTGRNQPSARDKIFLPHLPAWIHGLIRPQLGWGVAELDYSAQEVGIMAALSGDSAMMADYQSGDPYLQFGKRVKLMPPNATKGTHRELRECCKVVVLGMNYGMTPYGIAAKTGKSMMWARDVHTRHRLAYPVFTKWLADVVAQSRFDEVIYSSFGWPMTITGDSATRAIMNFPAQAGGADMMRITAIAATESGIALCAPVHDAFWITAPLDELDATVQRIADIMQRASTAVTGGLPIRIETAATVRWPRCLGDVRAPDEKGQAMWLEVNGMISEHLARSSHA
jgi:DNA polymerase-1